jgi:hypothetical protein
MGFLSDSRDRLAESMAQAYLNRSVLPAYGRLLALKLNSEQKTLDLTVELKGESSPVRILLQDYELTQENGRRFLTVRQIDTSREWLTAAANAWAAGRKFALPEQAGGMLAQFL